MRYGSSPSEFFLDDPSQRLHRPLQRRFVGHRVVETHGRQPFAGLGVEIATVDEEGLREILAIVRDLNPKVYKLQELTGDLSMVRPKAEDL